MHKIAWNYNIAEIIYFDISTELYRSFDITDDFFKQKLNSTYDIYAIDV